MLGGKFDSFCNLIGGFTNVYLHLAFTTLELSSLSDRKSVEIQSQTHSDEKVFTIMDKK